MIIKRIELTNWGPHKSLKADLLANVVGVIGGNGRGKSNFLQAIDYGLNGNLNKQNKECYIYNFGKEDGATKATVKIEFSKNGQDGEITRSITKSGSTRKLIWEGKEYKSDAEVSAQMAKIMGADKAAMANAIFIKQGCLAELVKGTPAERMAIFQKLMNLSFLDSRYNDLHNRIEKLKKGITDYRPSLDLVASMLKSVKDQIDTIKSNPVEDPTEDIAAMRYALSQLDRLETASGSVSAARGKLITATASLQDTLQNFSLPQSGDDALQYIETRTRDLGNLLQTHNLYKATKNSLAWSSSNVEELTKQLLQLQTDIEHSSKAILDQECIAALSAEQAQVSGAIRKHERKAELLRQLETQTEALERAQKELAEAEQAYAQLTANNDVIDSLQRTLDTHTAELNILELKRTYLQSDVVGEICPVCGNHMVAMSAEDREKAIAEVNKTISATETLIAHCRNGIAKEHAARSAAQDKVYATTYNHKVALRLQVTTNESLEEYSELDSSVEELRAVLSAITDKLNAHTVASTAVQSKKHSLESVKKNLSTELSRKTDLEQRMEKYASVELSNEEIVSAEKELSHLSIVRENVLTATAGVTAAKNMLENFMADKIAMEKELEEDEKLQITLEQHPDLALDLRDLEVQVDTYKTQQATLHSLREQLDKLAHDRAELVEKMQAEEERLKLIDDLETVAKITNKNGLPLAYMNSVFEHITGMVQDMLSKMGANFTVIKDETRPCTFRFIRTDDNTGYSMPQEMLSGGQAIRLSLALLIACQQLILPEVGLLVLDEPSSHMDAEGVDSLKELFLQMTSIFHSSETQLITVDHNPALIAALEKVIQL